jgi:hypothetical protein
MRISLVVLRLSTRVSSLSSLKLGVYLWTVLYILHRCLLYHCIIMNGYKFFNCGIWGRVEMPAEVWRARYVFSPETLLSG